MVFADPSQSPTPRVTRTRVQRYHITHVQALSTTQPGLPLIRDRSGAGTWSGDGLLACRLAGFHKRLLLFSCLNHLADVGSVPFILLCQEGSELSLSPGKNACIGCLLPLYLFDNAVHLRHDLMLLLAILSQQCRS